MLYYHVDCISAPPSTSSSLYVVAWHSVLYCHVVHVCVMLSEACIHAFCVTCTVFCVHVLSLCVMCVLCSKKHAHMHSVMGRYKGS